MVGHDPGANELHQGCWLGDIVTKLGLTEEEHNESFWFCYKENATHLIFRLREAGLWRPPDEQ